MTVEEHAMVEAGYLILILLGGMGLALIHIGGLWLTIGRLLTTRCPSALCFSSFWGRTILCAAGIFYLSAGRFDRLVVCMLGFWSVRAALLRHWRSHGLQQTVASR